MTLRSRYNNSKANTESLMTRKEKYISHKMHIVELKVHTSLRPSSIRS